MSSKNPSEKVEIFKGHSKVVEETGLLLEKLSVEIGALTLRKEVPYRAENIASLGPFLL